MRNVQLRTHLDVRTRTEDTLGCSLWMPQTSSLAVTKLGGGSLYPVQDEFWSEPG